MKWAIGLLVIATGCAGGGEPRVAARPSSRLGGAEATVFHVADADYERLWGTAMEAIEPFGKTVVKKPQGHIESRDYVRVENGLPRYEYIAIDLVPESPGSRHYQLAVAVYRYEKLDAEGLPFGDGEAEYTFVGVNKPLQDELARAIYQTYLEREVGRDPSR